MTKIKFIVGIALLMAVCYLVGYIMGVADTNIKWQLEQSKNWRPLIG